MKYAEIISSICADSCGLFIEDEPFYPGTKLRADFGVMCTNTSNDKSNRYKVNEKYVEILGKCGDKAYDNKTAEKQELAKKLGMQVLFINMTDEFNNLGSTTHFDMRKIEKLLIKFYFKNDFSNEKNKKISFSNKSKGLFLFSVRKGEKDILLQLHSRIDQRAEVLERNICLNFLRRCDDISAVLR